MPDTTAETDRAALDLLLRGGQICRMLGLVADLGIADRFGPEDNIDVAELAAVCGVQSQPLLRVIRALASLGIFRVTIDGKVTHTTRSRLLCTDAPHSLHHAARYWVTPGIWKTWGMLDVALTGGVPHEAVWGMGRFEYLRAHPDEARLFDATMANFPDDRHAAVVAAYDFSGMQLIADIGGGNGALLRHIVERYPACRGLIFDLEHVVQAIPESHLMAGRIAVAHGSFFDRVPAGADIYTLVRVLHDWSDQDCIRILRACRASMRADSLLLVGERLLEPDPSRGSPTDYLADMQMMAMFGSARERTEAEFHTLLTEAGLGLRCVIPTRSPVSILEIVAADRSGG